MKDRVLPHLSQVTKVTPGQPYRVPLEKPEQPGMPQRHFYWSILIPDFFKPDLPILQPIATFLNFLDAHRELLFTCPTSCKCNVFILRFTESPNDRHLSHEFFSSSITQHSEERRLSLDKK